MINLYHKGDYIKGRVKVSIACLVMVLFLGNAGHAHHLWIEKTDEGYVVARGMAPERQDRYNPECVEQFWAYAADGREILAENIRRIDDSERVRFRIPGPVSVAGISCDWGYRVNTAEGKKLLTRQEAEQAGLRVISSFFSTRFAKVFFPGEDPVEKPIGMKFEMVPSKNPADTSPEEGLSVQVLFDGEPMPELSIFARHGEEWKTDRYGIAHVKPAGKGLNLWMARHKVSVQGDPDKDYHLYTTFLIFEAE